MARSIIGFLVAGTLLHSIAFADDLKDDAIQQDRKRIQGTWMVVSLEVNGNKSKEEDVKKLTVVNRANGQWSLSSEDKAIVSGTSVLDPTTKPKSIDFTPIDGDTRGELHLGIYELGKLKRKLCFAPPGTERPTEFTSKVGSEHILVTFERVKAK